ncbi:TonB-dependent receptor [Parerythrobacter jejuensis]|uniref:TonB-dependent receptor n=1 Tax=Parerythrobacter jejuensis TaxID=795812 RepID=A0A845AQ79_9SPHN|nr:TonB-dependent receptor [Parerythrobacter jejuensis]MXP31774.1 TonB-dependent receptor [Parerythrobacter jejuensis]
MTKRSTILRHSMATACVAALATAGLAAPAYAQDAEEPAAETETGGLGVIVVTANRREENLQDVAISAATLQEDRVQALFAAGADNTALSGQVPGLFVESSNGRAAPRFYIRGLGNTDFDLAASQPVSVIMDDVVLENVTLKSFPLFDVDRIEVLRGPQGTLFGRNTPAGIVKIDTKKPTFETTAQGSLSYGSFGSVAVDFGIGGSLVDDFLAVRLSGLYQHRNDYIDNGFTGQEDALGEYDDFAIRGQVLLTPSEDLSILVSGQYRDLNGTSTLFRANILGPGNNDLNANYDRDTVFYDAGDGNQAGYETAGASAKVDYDAGFATLTSITSYYDSSGSSRGDIDGGFGAAFLPFQGPGFIPFPSDTQDSIELEQITHEVRLASNNDGPITWQVGGYGFWSDFSVTTQGFNFPPPVTVRHRNDAWAAFGQITAQVSEAIRLTGGLRYTEDDKNFVVVSGAAPQFRAVEESRVSWDLSAFADLSDDASVYARVASGFRAPTIQGRDVAFFNPPSIATSEKIMSYEVGFKSELADRRIRLNGAVFYYNVDDPQFTAVGGAGNLVQLVNANKGQGYGFELDSAFQITDYFTVTAGVAWNNTEIKDNALAVGICAQCTVTDPTTVINGTTRALVDGNPFPNAPEFTADVTAQLDIPVSDNYKVFAFTDWQYQGKTNFFLYESLEFNSNNQVEGGLRVGFGPIDGDWELAVFARNITNADNLKGGIDFNNNTAFVNEPRVIGISGRFSY